MGLVMGAASYHAPRLPRWDPKLKDKAISYAVLLDKRQLLRGEPTEIVSVEDSRKLNELVPLLLAELERRKIDVQMVADESGAFRPLLEPPAPKHSVANHSSVLKKQIAARESRESYE